MCYFYIKFSRFIYSIAFPIDFIFCLFNIYIIIILSNNNKCIQNEEDLIARCTCWFTYCQSFATLYQGVDPFQIDRSFRSLINTGSVQRATRAITMSNQIDSSRFFSNFWALPENLFVVNTIFLLHVIIIIL